MLVRLEAKNVTWQETLLYWTIEPDAREIVSQFGYIVQLSESPLGPWISLFEDPIYAFGYSDRKTVRGMIDQRLYYRIRAVDFVGKEFFSNTVCLFDEESNYITNYIAENEALLLRRYNGQDCLHFARRKFGERCNVCYDPALQKTITPKCRSCFGTTYKNGYFAPVKIQMNTDPKQKGTDKNDYGVAEATTLSGWVSNSTIIEADDILAFLKKPSERYIVNSILPTSINGNTVRQILTLTQLKADHPAQLLKVDVEAYTLDEFNIFRREWKQ